MTETGLALRRVARRQTGKQGTEVKVSAFRFGAASVAASAMRLPGYSKTAATVLLATLMGLSGFMSNFLLEGLRFDRIALAAGEWWRPFTAHLAHADLRHGLVNGLALLAIERMARNRIDDGTWWIILGGSILAVDAGLYWGSPAVEWYAGASGALHGLFAGVALCLLLCHRDLTGVLMLLLLTGKLLVDGLGPSSSPWLAGSAFHVINVAHVYGALGGLLSAFLISPRAAATAIRSR